MGVAVGGAHGCGPWVEEEYEYFSKKNERNRKKNFFEKKKIFVDIFVANRQRQKDTDSDTDRDAQFLYSCSLQLKMYIYKNTFPVS